jgi:hypothetical protein
MKSLSLPTPTPTRPRSSRWSVCLAAAIALAAPLTHAAPSTTVVISQVYGGGGNSGAPYTNDFVELHNISNSSVSITGWRIQYASATGTSWSTGVNLSGSIPPGGYFLVQGAGGVNGISLPTPDLTSTINLSGTAGKVALTNTTTLLTGTNPVSDPSVIDFVGFGITANGFEGTGPTPAPSNTTSVTRGDFGSLDTDNNATDFTAGAPSPRNGASTPYIPGGDSVAPTLASTTPTDNASGVAITTNLVMTFSEPVLKGTGDITLKLSSNNSTVATIPVTDGAVTVAGTTATITLSSNLDPSTGYYVNIASGAFKDAANNLFTGIGDNSTWNFTTGVVDGTPPSVATLVPADNALNVLPTTNLTLTFDENILAGSGSVVIKKLSDNSVVETLTVPGAKVAVAGATATLNPDTTLEFATNYYVEVSSGAFKDLATNNFTGISGNSTWNFTTRAAPVLLISQYYEGAGLDRYIELKNLTGSPLSLDGYRVVSWSDTPPSDNEGWKSGTNTSTRVTDLTGKTIPANGTLLIAESGVTAPTYAANNYDLSDSGGCTAFNGDDSVVLYQGAGFSQEEVVDAVSFVANDGADKSFYRLNNGVGFDFASGTSILNYPGVWGTKTLTEVADATPTDEWYLKATQPIGTLTLTFDPSAFSEAAGSGASTATVTRSGDPSQSLFVSIQTVGSKATAPEFVEIPANLASGTFSIDAINDPWLLGDATVTFTVSVLGYLPTSAEVTVFDQESDAPFPVVINEVDADTPGIDSEEFIELYNSSGSPLSLDGLVLVLYNGSGDVSYNTIDLTGFSIPANDFFVIGSATVPNVDLIAFTTDGIQNGADAVALYAGAAAAFPNGTLANTTAGILIDALVYDTSDADDVGLLAALLPAGKPQVDENINSSSATESMSRVPNGGVAYDTTLYAVQTPTPGATNVIAPPGNTFASWIGTFDFSGFTNPDLTATGDPDNDGLDNALENIFGTSPAAFSQGLSAVSTAPGQLKFRHTRNATPASDLTPSYEWSPDLVNWYASGVNAGGITVTFGTPTVEAAGPPELVEVTASITGTASKVFARVKVVQN